MINNQSQTPPTKKRTHWPSFIVLFSSGLGLMFFFGIAGATFFAGFTNLIGQDANASDTAILFSYTAAGIVLCLLLLPSILLAIKRISGEVVSTSRVLEKAFALFHPKRLIWLFPLVVLFGHLIASRQSINWIFLPGLNILALGIPIAWLLWVGIRRLNPGSLQRNWSTFGAGITVSPLIIMVIEIVFMVIGFLMIILLFSLMFTGAEINPESLFSALTQGSNIEQMDGQEIVSFIQQPIILIIILFFISGFVPIVEELIKPLAVWLMWFKPLTPQDGWVLGLLSGAGFALVENLGNITAGEGWTFLVLARAGASALHMFNTAIISYTVVLARVKKRFLPAVLAIIGTILIHGFWNGISIFATFASPDSADSAAIWPTGFIIAIVIISVSLVGGIFFTNQRLAAKSTQTAAVEANHQPDLPEPEVPGIHESEK
jgi:hypothetical protein